MYDVPICVIILYSIAAFIIVFGIAWIRLIKGVGEIEGVIVGKIKFEQTSTLAIIVISSHITSDLSELRLLSGGFLNSFLILYTPFIQMINMDLKLFERCTFLLWKKNHKSLITFLMFILCADVTEDIEKNERLCANSQFLRFYLFVKYGGETQLEIKKSRIGSKLKIKDTDGDDDGNVKNDYNSQLTNEVKKEQKDFEAYN
ncbi:15537_t:CDS:2 [Dentiscutata erythropus]|uniref:15537_t:CDS:1 n=1 Tax=Dentiscutata erythropus TaxID=1348616 RepID=A0A9N8VCB5_9GLOM|nr:15537_t:CDS:2 [Dentiscutata erythropus]